MIGPCENSNSKIAQLPSDVLKGPCSWDANYVIMINVENVYKTEATIFVKGVKTSSSLVKWKFPIVDKDKFMNLIRHNPKSFQVSIKRNGNIYKFSIDSHEMAECPKAKAAVFDLNQEIRSKEDFTLAFDLKWLQERENVDEIKHFIHEIIRKSQKPQYALKIAAYNAKLLLERIAVLERIQTPEGQKQLKADINKLNLAKLELSKLLGVIAAKKISEVSSNEKEAFALALKNYKMLFDAITDLDVWDEFTKLLDEANSMAEFL